MSEHKIDKTGWADGPWMTEPDRVEWRSNGVPCLLVRNKFGSWCGYVGVAPGHPWHGKAYQSDELMEIEVHGGLTYSEVCRGPVCHVPGPGESEDIWWLGFDTGHAWDYSPGIAALRKKHSSPLFDNLGEVYRNQLYVTAQTEKLAAQALEAAKT